MVELLELEEAATWRRNRDLKVLGHTIAWMVSMWGRVDGDQVGRQLPGYDMLLDVTERLSAIERQPDVEELAPDGTRRS